MAEPSWWEPVPSDEIWDPLANSGDWTEVASEGGPEPGGSWARDDASVTYVGDIPFAKRYDARRKMVGYAYADTAYPYQLHRVNPIPHPDERQLRCVSVDIGGYNPEGVEQPDLSFKSGYPAPYITGVPAGTILFPRSPTYSRARCTLRFRPHAYPFLTDAAMVAGSLPEVFRNTAFFDSCDPVLDLLVTDGDPFLEWAETATDGPTVGDKITSQTPEYIQRANFVAIWYHVPIEFIIDPSSYLPAKIMAGVGLVNDSTWYGFPAGTLRLEAPRFRKVTQAAIRIDPSLASAPPYVYDVVLPFSWVDPTPAAATPLFRGWNLFPFSSTGKFFSLRRSGSSPGTPLPYFAGYDFNKLFEHVSAP